MPSSAARVGRDKTMGTGLYFATSFKPLIGGGEEHAHQMATALTRAGERIIVLSVQNDTPAERAFDASVEYELRRRLPVFTTSRNPIRFAAAKFELFRRAHELIMDVRPDYILGNTGTSLVPNIASRLAAKSIGGVPRIGILHHCQPNNEERPRSRYARIREYTALRSADAVLCVSHYTRADAIHKAGVKPERAFVAYNGLDHSAINAWRAANPCIAPSSARRLRRPTILSVSRLEVYKGVQRVIEALPLVRDYIPSIRYVIVGDGSYRPELERLASQSDASAAIEFRGALTDDDKWAAYADADVFVLPSSEEGFGVVYLEAAAFGVPSIGWDVMAVPEAIQNGSTGLLVRAWCDRDQFARQIASLFTDGQYRRALGGQARLHAAQFTWDKAAAAVLERIAALREE